MLRELIFNRIGSRAAANGLFLLSLTLLLRNILKAGSFGFTGLIFGSILPAIIFVAGLFILKPELSLNLEWKNLKAQVPSKIILVSLCGLYFIYYFLNLFSFDLHAPLMMLLAFLSCAYLAMLYCQFSGKLDGAVYIFFICFPLLNLAEYWMGISAGTFENSLVFTPTVFFLISLFIGALIAGRKKDIQLSKIHIAMFICLGVFLLSGLVSALLSISPADSLRHYLLQYVYPLMILPVVFLGINSLTKLKLFINMLIISFFMNVVIFFYMFQRYGKGFSSLIDVYNASMASGITSGILAILILFIFPLVLFMIFASDKAYSRRPYYVVSLILLVLLFLTFSRSGLISFFMGALALFFTKKIRQILWIIGFTILILAFIFYFLASSPALNRYTTLMSGLKDPSSQAHFNAWVGAVEMIKDHPICGIGAGMWDRYVAHYVPTQNINFMMKGNKWAKGYIVDPHNIYLTVYLETGLIGFLFWVSLQIILIIFTVNILQNNPNDLMFSLGLTYLIFIMANAIHSLSTSDLLLNGLFMYGSIFWAIHGVFARNVFGPVNEGLVP